MDRTLGTLDSISELQEEIDYHARFVTDHKKQRIAEVLEQRTRHVVVALEDLYQPQNASAVLRTCDCFGIQEAHVIENEHRFYVSSKVTKGCDKWLDIPHYRGKENNTSDCIKTLKDAGYKIAATTLDGWQHTIEDVPIDDKIAIFFGTELHGLSQEVLDAADYRMIIPMVGFSQSFNISVSAAITLYRLTTRMREANINWQLKEDDKLQLTHRWYKSITQL